MITVEAKRLLAAIDAAATAAAKSGPFPILEHVMLSSDDGALTAVGTDGVVQVAALSDIPFDGDSFTVDAEKLRRLLRSMGDAEVSLSFDDDRATLSAGRSRYTLNAHHGYHYPVLDESSDLVASIRTDAEKLRQAIEYAAPAMAKNDVRHYLNGMRIEATDKRVDVVATDGHRMGHAWLDAHTDGREAAATIPPRAVTAITKVRLSGEVVVAFRENTVSFSGNGTRVTTKVIGGQFPEWRRVIPEDDGAHAVVFKKDFLKALERVSVTADRFRSVLVTIRDRVMRLETGADGESGADEIECQFGGDEFSAAYNAGYVLDAVRVAPGDEIVMLVTDETRPAVFICVDTIWETLVMPMRR